MKTMHQTITEYIDQAIEKSVDKAAEKAAKKAVIDARPEMERFFKRVSDEARRENARHMKDLKTFFSHEVSIVAEIARSRPTEERVREIVREETR